MQPGTCVLWTAPWNATNSPTPWNQVLIIYSNPCLRDSWQRRNVQRCTCPLPWRSLGETMVSFHSKHTHCPLCEHIGTPPICQESSAAAIHWSPNMRGRRTSAASGNWAALLYQIYLGLIKRYQLLIRANFNHLVFGGRQAGCPKNS